MADQTPDPIEYPTVKINGKTYEVRFRWSDVIRLRKEHNIEMFGSPEKQFDGPTLERVALMLQAGIAHQSDVSLEVITNSLDFENAGDYISAVLLAQKKAYTKIMSQMEKAGIQDPKPSQPAPLPSTSPIVQ